jgi:hypothetical protein
MSNTKITAPVKGFTGVGVGGLSFDNGVAHTDNEAIISYCRDAGYGIGDKKPTAHTAGDPVPDARDYADPIPVGTPLRDAAVDPQPQDYLPPSNAGEADPHGPLVVAPEIAKRDRHRQPDGDGQPVVTPLVETPPQLGDTGPLEEEPVTGELPGGSTSDGELPPGSEPEPPTGERTGPDNAPDPGAKVAEWRAFAKSVEVNPDRHDEIDKTSKAELMAQYGPAPASA